MKFDICDVFNQDEYDEIRKFLLEKLNHIPEEATISDVSMELHKIVEEVLYEYEVDMWLEGLIELINKPLCQCPQCKGTGYLDDISKIEFNYS